MIEASSEEAQGPISKVQRVRNAADTLGISERTVYRRLRAGTIEALSDITKPTDTVMTNDMADGLVELLRTQDTELRKQLECQNDMTIDKLSCLWQNLSERDAQIRVLLQNQQELTLTIQNLQEQIYELARLALTQTVRAEEHALALPVRPEQIPAQKAVGLRGWLRSIWSRTGSR